MSFFAEQRLYIDGTLCDAEGGRGIIAVGQRYYGALCRD